MHKLTSASLLLFAAACGGPAAPEAPAASPPAGDETRVEVVREPVSAQAAAEPPPAVPPAPADPLTVEREQMLAEHAREVERFTPELRAQGAALAAKSFPSTRAGLAVILKSPHRKPGHAERDAQRHPRETLEFLGVTPKQSVLEYGPGEGWYSELLAPLLAKQGKLLATNPDPNGPPEARSTFYGQRFKLFLETSPELYGKVETLIVNGAAPALPAGTQVDTVLVFRGLHGMVNQGTLSAWLAAFHAALKDKGVLGVEQHRAKPDADPTASAKLGYLPEAWVISEIEKAGFKLQKKSEVNANPRDTKDHPDGVWDLPPSYKRGDVERDKYTAIGESDRMTLKFVKVAPPAAAAKGTPPAPAAPPAPPSAPPAPATAKP